jgi:hypothetical protein
MRIFRETETPVAIEALGLIDLCFFVSVGMSGNDGCGWIVLSKERCDLILKKKDAFI